MKCVPLVTLLCLITASECVQIESKNVEQDFIRSKRQDTPWVWGNKSSNQPTSSAALPRTSTTASAPKPHPCDPFVPPRKPDLRRGRRISQAKCLEYVWEIKVRNDNDTHENECTKWRTQLWGRRLVVGGRDTVPGEFPHMGALGWRAVQGTWLFKCGSSLISSNYVVTAAHCSSVARGDTTVSDVKPQIVRLGDKNIIDMEIDGVGPIDAKISRIIVHPQYAAPKKYFDIALVELADRVTFTKVVQPACLWGKIDTSDLGSQATVTGWGFVDSARTKTAPELQVAVLDFVDQDQCDKLLKPSRTRLFSGLQPHQFCAGKLTGGVDTCQGDSGGPLQVKIALPITSQGSLHHLVGVTSFGIGCALPNSPGVYTRVACFIDWIENIVWGT